MAPTTVCRRGNVGRGDVGRMRVGLAGSIVEIAADTAPRFAEAASHPDPRDPRVRIELDVRRRPEDPGAARRGARQARGTLLTWLTPPASSKKPCNSSRSSARGWLTREDRCKTLDLPVSRTFLENAIGVAVMTKHLPRSSPILKLPPSHKTELLGVSTPEKAENLAAKVIEGSSPSRSSARVRTQGAREEQEEPAGAEAHTDRRAITHLLREAAQPPGDRKDRLPQGRLRRAHARAGGRGQGAARNHSEADGREVATHLI